MTLSESEEHHPYARQEERPLVLETVWIPNADVQQRNIYHHPQDVLGLSYLPQQVMPSGLGYVPPSMERWCHTRHTPPSLYMPSHTRASCTSNKCFCHIDFLYLWRKEMVCKQELVIWKLTLNIASLMMSGQWLYILAVMQCLLSPCRVIGSLSIQVLIRSPLA